MRAACAVSAAAASAALGVGATLWCLSAERAAHDTSDAVRLIMLRCSTYWNRSGIADAAFEFRNGRNGLLQIIRARDPSLDYWTPGLRPGAIAETRRGPPIPGPSFAGIDLEKIDGSQRWCNDDRVYAWDYNITMLRLLGRERDIQLPDPSPEISTMRR